MKLLSIQLGRPSPLGHLLSAIRKEPVAGPVLLRQTGLAGWKERLRPGKQPAVFKAVVSG